MNKESMIEEMTDEQIENELSWLHETIDKLQLWKEEVLHEQTRRLRDEAIEADARITNK